MSGIDALLAREACTRLCADFAAHADEKAADALAGLFIAEGMFDRLGQIFTGHAAIRDVIAARPAEIWVRHYTSNVRIDLAADGQTASGRCHLLMFRGRVGAEGHEVIHAGYEDAFVLTDAGWRFSSRKVIARP